MLKILILEDDEKILKSIKSAIQRGMKEAFVYATSSGQQAMDIITDEKNIDIFILDVYLPNISGLKIAEFIRCQEYYSLTPIIFISGDATRELSLYQEFQCYTFLEKPFNIKVLLDRLEIVHKAKEKYCNISNESQQVFEAKNGCVKINLNDILFFEYENRNCYLHTRIEKILLKSMTLKELEQTLPQFFMRSHKSFIVNHSKIKEIKYNKHSSDCIKFHNTNKKAFMGKKYNVFLDSWKETVTCQQKKMG